MRTLFGVAVICCALSTSVLADTTTDDSSVAMRGYRDPATGKRTEGPVTPEQQREAAHGRKSPDFTRMRVEYIPGRGRVLYPAGQISTTSVATRNQDGSIQHECIAGVPHEHDHPAETDGQ